MNKIRSFIKTSLLGGFAVILPITVSILIFKWFFNIVIQLIHPLTKLIVVRAYLQVIVANAIVIGIILSACFFIGVILKTKIGQFIHENIDRRLSKIIPGYGIIQSTITQLFNREKPPFSSVALVRAFGNDTLMTALVTDEHADGSYTVFVPCGPNPTTGYIFHLQRQYVHSVPVSVEEAIRSVISCGAGSKPLLEAFRSGKTKQA
ncbi:MAG TPA: DUF502 domain-containing protein [Deltaproteobacteria bacterium]|nr:DUF502 domain-containing protein [Deltaproteobacteria bacterium]